MTVEIEVSHADAQLRKDGSWSEVPRKYTRTRTYPETWYVLVRRENRTAKLRLFEDHTYELVLREEKLIYPSESDKWVPGHLNLFDESTWTAIVSALEDTPLIVEHGILAGGSAPFRFVVESEDDLIKHIYEDAKPGDFLHFWNFSALCLDGNTMFDGKIPDSQGRGFRGGGY